LVVDTKGIAMAEERQNSVRQTKEKRLALILTEETGITLDQAHDLIAMIGTDRPSLLREARILKQAK